MFHDSPLVAQLVNWLAATPVSVWLQALTTNQPLLLVGVQTLHLLGMAVVITANGFVAIGLLGWLRPGEALATVTTRIVPWVMAALALMLASGLFLIVRWPARILLSPAFVPKLAIIVLGIAILHVTARTLRRSPERLRAQSPAAIMLGVLLILVWSSAVVAGRWIPFA
jgi:hypothetical protein